MGKGINFLEGGPGEVVDLTENRGFEIVNTHGKRMNTVQSIIKQAEFWKKFISARLDCNEIGVCVFPFFFFFQPTIVDFVNCEQCIRVLFTVPQITLFSHFFIKNGSHSTIYKFKNYFATVFSVSVFNFSKNKLNPNTPIVQYCNPMVRYIELLLLY